MQFHIRVAHRLPSNLEALTDSTNEFLQIKSSDQVLQAFNLLFNPKFYDRVGKFDKPGNSPRTAGRRRDKSD